MRNDKELLKVAILAAIAGTIVAIVWYIICRVYHISFVVGLAVPLGIAVVCLSVAKVIDKNTSTTS